MGTCDVRGRKYWTGQPVGDSVLPVTRKCQGRGAPLIKKHRDSQR